MSDNNRKVITLSPKYFVISILSIFFVLSYYIEMKFPDSAIYYVAYYDEIISIISAVYFFYIAFFKRLADREDIYIFFLFIVLSIITFISNYQSKLIDEFVPIATDFDALLKLPFPYLAAKYIVRNDKGKVTVLYLRPFAKLMILVSFVFGTLSMFFDLGMAGMKRYGIPSFKFIFNSEAMLGLIVSCCLLIIVESEKVTKKVIIYEVLATFVFVYTTKGSIYTIPIIYYVLLFFSRKERKLSWKNILVMAAAIIPASSFQIKTYLMDDESPRMLLLRNGFRTANYYFPLGSGFATYGSDQASRNYSKLYYRYGFNHVWGMAPESGTFLNDCYISMVFAQFGYIGAAVFFVIMGIIFSQINKYKYSNTRAKSLCIAIMLSHFIATIGLALIKSSIGVMSFILIGFVAGYMRNEANLEHNTVKNPLARTRFKFILK